VCVCVCVFVCPDPDKILYIKQSDVYVQRL